MTNDRSEHIAEILLKDDHLLPFNFVRKSLAEKLDLVGPYGELDNKHLSHVGIPSEPQFNPVTGEFVEIESSGQKDTLLEQIQESIEWWHEHGGHYTLSHASWPYYNPLKISSFNSLGNFMEWFSSSLAVTAQLVHEIAASCNCANITQEYNAFRTQRNYLSQIKMGSVSLWSVVQSTLQEALDDREVMFHKIPHAVALSQLETETFGPWKSDLMKICHETFVERDFADEVMNNLEAKYARVLPDVVLMAAATADPDDVLRCRSVEEEQNFLMERLRKLRPGTSVDASMNFGVDGEAKHVRYFVSRSRPPDSNVEWSRNLDLGPKTTVDLFHDALRYISGLRVLLEGSHIVSIVADGKWRRQLYFERSALEIASKHNDFPVILEGAKRIHWLRDQIIAPILYATQVTHSAGTFDRLRFSKGKITDYENFFKDWDFGFSNSLWRDIENHISENYALLYKNMHDVVTSLRPLIPKTSSGIWAAS